jgi:hypothetical protein
MAKISLALKKNLRDNDAEIKTHAAKLDQFAGGPVTVDCDFAAFNEVLSLSSSYTDRAGEAVKWLVEGLAYRWDYLFKDNEIFKTCLAKAWTSKKLVIKADWTREGGGDYHKVTMENGDLVIHCDKTKDGYIVSNVSDVGTSALKTLGLKTDAGMSVSLAINVAEYSPKIHAAEKDMAEKTGISGVKFNVNFIELDGWLRGLPDNGGHGYEDRAGEVAVWMIEGLQYNVNRCAGDDLVKEALQEAWKGEIVIAKPDPKLEDYHVSELKNGQLILKTRQPMSNVSDCGKDLEKRL